MNRTLARLRSPSHLVTKAIGDALAEDLGLVGDLTTLATVATTKRASAQLIARQKGVICGLELAHETFSALNKDCVFSQKFNDGDAVEDGALIAEIKGAAHALLTGERVALNFMAHLSGIATLTQAYVAKVKGTKAKITDTRKTTPGLRALEKYAVRCGGGHNHRSGLFDAMMIKDNHILAAGGIGQAISAAKKAAGHMLRIEVEVDTLAQLDEVLKHGNIIDAVLLDNMDLETLECAVSKVSGALICEASGGVTLDTVSDIARTGVDIISVGALTHSAPALDLGLDFNNPTA